MRSFLHTLYGKISIIFLALIVVLGAVQIYVSVQSAVNYVCESNQKLNYTLAANLAAKFQPHFQDGLDLDKIKPIIDDLMALNPKVDIYLLNRQGRLLAAFTDPDEIARQAVDTRPIKMFLNPDQYSSLPIFGDDPRTGNRRKIFSAADVTFGNETGYVYIILASARYELASDGVRDSYILSTSAVVLSATLIVGALVGLILFFFLTKRLHAMTGMVRDFTRGRYEQRIKIRSDDEVGELGLAFNNMAATIEENLKAMQRNDDLRRELIANISHDLRSPLASVQGYLETVVMKEDDLKPEQRRDYLETTLKNVKHLNQLVHQLFELSKLDAKEAKPNSEPFLIAELVQDVILKFQPQAEERGVHLLSKLAVDLPLVFGDIGMIERVLSNLIDNALRYTPRDGRVTVALSRQTDSTVEISVRDTGKGIPEEDLAHIFDRFYRVDKSRSREAGGSGLGLAIAKKIVRAHDSDLEVESRLNHGTLFRFRLNVYIPQHASLANSID